MEFQAITNVKGPNMNSWFGGLRRWNRWLALLLLLASGAGPVVAADAIPLRGWFNWRGPGQDGISPETHLPDTWAVNGTNQLWSYPLAGRGVPVIAGNRVYAIGYDGEGADQIGRAHV